jgi:tetratricopeptide (TPR) repeat protein
VALKLYDRALDITPDDPNVIAAKAGIYQAQGNLQEAARLLSRIDWQTPSEVTFAIKISQAQLERNYAEAVRLLQTRQAHFHFGSDYGKASNQVDLALAQRLAGDTADAKVTAEEARNTLVQLYGDHPDDARIAKQLSQAHAVMGEKDSALKAAERAITLLPSAQDPFSGPAYEEYLAQTLTILGENSSAISTLSKLLRIPYACVPAPITPTLLRLEPIWDPLRSDPAFQKLCEEKIDKSIAVQKAATR